MIKTTLVAIIVAIVAVLVAKIRIFRAIIIVLGVYLLVMVKRGVVRNIYLISSKVNNRLILLNKFKQAQIKKKAQNQFLIIKQIQVSNLIEEIRKEKQLICKMIKKYNLISKRL